MKKSNLQLIHEYPFILRNDLPGKNNYYLEIKCKSLDCPSNKKLASARGSSFQKVLDKVCQKLKNRH